MLPNFRFDTFIVLHEVVSSMSSVKLNNSKCDSVIIWDVVCVFVCVIIPSCWFQYLQKECLTERACPG